VLPSEITPRAEDAHPERRRGYRLARADAEQLLGDPGVEDDRAVLYHLLLAGVANPQSWYALTNLLQHYVTPVITIAVWAVAGPRGRFSLSDTFTVFIIPIAYLAYTLVHGAIASVYPYGFFNVIKYGYASVLMLMLGVIVGGYVVALLYLGAERLLRRRGNA
jgi:hypothetical protein